MVIEKKCTGPCGLSYPLNETGFRLTKQGWFSRCRGCERADGRQYYADHKDEYRRRKAKYRANGKLKEWVARRYQKHKAREKARSSAWQKLPHVKVRISERRRVLKRRVFEIYGGAFCACCSENELSMLTLDHVNNDGAAERKAWKSDGGVDGFYRKLKKKGFPAGYQVLCMNCNVAKYHNQGICPHATRRRELIAA